MIGKKNSFGKKIVIGVLAGVLVFGAVAGVIYAASKTNNTEVLVIPVKQADYGTNSEYDNVMDGIISTGTSQTITYDSNRLVESIPVHEGDHVKEGDVLVSYDTTEARINLEQKQLDIRVAEMELQNARNKLAALNAAREVFIPDEPEEEEEEDEEDSDNKKEKKTESKEDDNEGNVIDEEADDEEASEEDEEAEEDDTAYEEVTVSEELGEGVEPTESVGTQGPGDALPQGSTQESSEASSQQAEQTSGTVPVTEATGPGTFEWMDSNGDTYSAEELRKEKISTENDIRTLTTDLAEAELALKNANKKLEGNIETASMDGVVTLVDDTMVGVGLTGADLSGENSEPAPRLPDGEPMVRVSTFEGLYVESAVNEWSLAHMAVGDTVYVTDWGSGGIYKARVTEISDYASEYAASMYALDDTSDSYFPITALIMEDGLDLEDGDSVEVSLTKPEDFEDEEDDGKEPIYLYKAFVLSEGPKRYVYKKDENDKLVKQEIEVSGQEPETYIVTGGITRKDRIAFPFGDAVREGAPVYEGDIDELYAE